MLWHKLKQFLFMYRKTRRKTKTEMKIFLLCLLSFYYNVNARPIVLKVYGNDKKKNK